MKMTIQSTIQPTAPNETLLYPNISTISETASQITEKGSRVHLKQEIILITILILSKILKITTKLKLTIIL